MNWEVSTMKSRISFFNKAIFRKNITRFFPVWALYTIFLLLVFSTFADAGYPGRTARNLADSMGPLVWVNLLYAFLCAALLLGDLFQGRMCNALHALPLRRETWLGTHVITGLLFSLVPNALITVIAAALTTEYAFIALLWLAIMTLQFLFFFGTAVFAALCAGSRLGMAAVYGIFHLITMLVYALAELIYQPLLYGISFDSVSFYRFFPLFQLQNSDYVPLLYLPTSMEIVFQGIQPKLWIYAGLCAGVGVLFIGLALMVYRRRQLESAGDFLSLRPLKPVFLVLYTLGMGAVFFLASELFIGEPVYLFLAVGLVVGFFTGQMLLNRSVRVFKKKMLLQFGVFIAVFGLSLGLTKMDPLGITTKVPKTEDVQWAAVYSLDYSYAYNDNTQFAPFQITDPEEIEQLRQFHGFLTVDRTETEGRKENVIIQYTRKDGSRLVRHYQISIDTPAGQQAKAYFSDMRYIFQVNEPQQLSKNIESVKIYSYEPELLEKFGFKPNTEDMGVIKLTEPEQIARLLDAIGADCDAGNMAQYWSYHEDEAQPFSIEFSLTNLDGDFDTYVDLQIFESAENTLAYLKDYFSAMSKQS